MNLRKIKFWKGRIRRSLLNTLEGIRVNKRQRLISAVLFLSLGLFVSEHLLGKSGIFIVFALSVLTDVFLFIALFRDLRENFSWQVFILPFFFSLAFGLFYLLVPARFLTRIVMTSLYAVGLYSLFLSQNIFTVSSIRTIALLSSARTVSFAIALLSFFFLTNVVFSLHTNLFINSFLIFSFTLPMVASSIWMYTLEKNIFSNFIWTIFLTIAIFESSIMLWFWPSTPTLIALFLTGIFYTVVGISAAWFEKRLFRGVMLEYFWVAIVTFVVLLFFTIWS